MARIRASVRSVDIMTLGYVADDLLSALYNGAEAFILPSLFEGFGMGVIEAMACGCPVVTSNTTSLVEVSGDAAVNVDPRSVPEIVAGIRKALDPVAAAQLRDAGIRHAAAFNWPAAAMSTLNAIRRAYEESSN